MTLKIDAATAQEQWDRFEYCRDHGHLEFLTKADRCENFFAGQQWEEADLNLLQLQRRPAITINKILSTISTILGEQIYNRVEVLFRQANGSPAEVAEALTKVWMQISQNNQLQWVRSDVFCDGIIRSRGFYDVRLDFTDSMMGEVRVSQLNSKNVVIDPDAEEYDPDSWNDVFITKWLTLQDIELLYDKAAAEHLKGVESGFMYGYDSIERVRDRFAGTLSRNINYMGEDDQKVERSVRTLERQYRRLDKQEHFVDVYTGDMRPVPSSWERDRISQMLEKMGGQLAVTEKLVKRVRWTVTADNLVLHDDWSPYKHFTTVPYFPYFRYGKTIGIVENLLGSQEILNKVSSQELHVINTTANSGWLIEAGSLINMSLEELEQKGAQTGLVLEYMKNAQAPAKIQPNQVPSGLDRVSYKAEEHIKAISGVSDSMQGFDRSDVAARAIEAKQQRGMVNMTKPMDNLERTDYLLARNVLDLVQEFYTEPRIINITNDNVTHESEEVEINGFDETTGQIVNDLTVGEYSIVISSQPHRASLEDTQFDQARGLREIGVNIPDRVLIESSRLMNKADIIKTIEGDQESEEYQQQKALEMRAAEAEVAKLEAEGQDKAADAQLKLVRAQRDAVDTQKAAQEAPDAGNSIEAMKIQAEIELERWKLEQEFALKREMMQAEMQLKREMHAEDIALKRAQALRQQARGGTPE